MLYIKVMAGVNGLKEKYGKCLYSERVLYFAFSTTTSAITTLLHIGLPFIFIILKTSNLNYFKDKICVCYMYSMHIEHVWNAWYFAYITSEKLSDSRMCL